MKTFIWNFVLLSFFGSFAHAQSLEPGMWKASTSFTVNELPLPPSVNEECISPDQAKDAKGTITKELKKNGCVLTSWKVTGQNLEAALTCDNDQLSAKGTLHGKFTAKSYLLDGEATGTFQKLIPSTATLKLKGDWTKACVAETK